MANIFQSVREWFAPIQTLPAGMYHYISPPEDTRNYRLHLRIETDGSGVLIVNAATILHLNQTAAELAYYIVQNVPPDQAARRLAARFHVSRDQALADYTNLIDRIQLLINTPDLDPETFLDFDRRSAHSGPISAPYRLDCALTYRLPAGDSPETAPVERVKRELSTQEWQQIIDKAFAIGIPHIVFTGGEPTLRPDLVDLIGHAEANNQITGLISDGLKFNDADYLNAVLNKGLDHLMLVFDPEQKEAWSALENVLAADLFVAVHLTLSEASSPGFAEVLDRLVELGVKAISLSSNSQAMKTQIEAARNLVAAKNLELIWNLPVPYSSFHPVALETVQWESIPGAGRDWLYVEPDGDVLPTQGQNQVLGNFLQDPWEIIWKK
jgi:organic radical activating enzyme